MSELEPLLITLDFFSNISPGGPGIPNTSVDGRFLTVDFDQQGVVIADLKKGVARGIIGEEFLQSDLHLRYYILEAVALSMISALRAVALHAACIAWKGIGILLCGESGAGKTTLAYACARVGWTYVSGDASYLVLPSRTSRVVGNHHQIRFRDAATKLFDELACKRVSSRIGGKPSIELPTAELADIRTTPYADIECILFLNRNADLQPSLHPMETTAVSDYFERFFLIPPDSGSPLKDAMNRLLSVPAFELRYAHLDSAVSFLTQAIGNASKWPVG